MIYRSFIRPILFKKDAEDVHNQVFSLIKNTFKIPLIGFLSKLFFGYKSYKLERKLFGIKFPNPIGLAAGFDKDAKLFEELACFGFGFIEVGTVTPKSQDGNPKPRLFRLPEDKGLINRMGFNNGGVSSMILRLKKRKSSIIIGGNIGKNKLTPNEEAVSDYLSCFNDLFDYVDYFVVNVSSPNTPNLRELQEKEPLTKLLMKIQSENDLKSNRKPILLKIAPDLSNEQLDDIVDIMKQTNLDGLIATNTTIQRSGLKTSNKEVEIIGAGGLSGIPVQKRSTEVISYLSKKSGKSFPIVAVGGVFTAEDAIEKLEAGADLIQVYTGFIYEGPAMVKRINKGILKYYESK